MLSTVVHSVDPCDVAAGHSSLVVGLKEGLSVFGLHGLRSPVLGEGVVSVQHDGIVVEGGEEKILTGLKKSELCFHT